MKLQTIRTVSSGKIIGTKQTSYTFDFTGCTLETIAPGAMDSYIIQIQNRQRKTGVVPQTLTVNVLEHLASVRSRQPQMPETVETLAAKGASMTAEERKALIELLKNTK